MMRLGCLAIFLIISNVMFGQNNLKTVDSVYQHCVQNPHDTDAINQLNSQINRLYNRYPDSVQFYTIKQVELAKNANSIRLEARAYIAWGICQEIQGNLDSAIALYQIANKKSMKTNNLGLKASVYNNLGIVYSYKGLYESSLEYTLKAMQIQEERNDSSGMAMIYNNLGLRYSELGNQENAIKYYKKAIVLNRAINRMYHLGTNYCNLGRSLYIKRDLDSSKSCYDKALRISKQEGDLYNQSLVYDGLAHILLEQKKINTAQLYLDSLLVVATSISDDYGINNAKFTQGVILQAKGDYKNALVYFLAFEKWVLKNRYGSSQPDVYRSISDTYKALGNFPKALEYMQFFADAKDSILSDQKDLALEQISIYKQGKLQREKDVLNKEISIQEIAIEHEQNLKNIFVLIGGLLLLIAMGIGHRYLAVKKTKKVLAEKNKIIESEKERSEALLLNILPEEIAQELKEKGKADARDFDMVSILFTDFKDFTKTSATLNATDLVKEINTCFETFDGIIEKYNIEKIKTIGDSYMAAGGLPVPTKESVKNTVLAALEMQQFIKDHKLVLEAENRPAFEMRVGIHTGPVVAGIVGVKKFQYDIWGDTVNTASRMESNGKVGKVNISKATYELLKNESEFAFESRGKIKAKGKGEIEMWFVMLK